MKVELMYCLIDVIVLTRARINIKVRGDFRWGSHLSFYALQHSLRISELWKTLHISDKKVCEMFGVYVIKQ